MLRRGLSVLALLLALQLTLGATRPAPTGAPTAPSHDGAAVTLPLAAPADHLTTGDEVGVYLPGRADPVLTGATVLRAPSSTSGTPVVRITLRRDDVGQLLREMAPERGGGTGFVLVRDG